MFDTINLNKKMYMLLPVVAYDTVQETVSWLSVSFVFHIMSC